MDVIRSQTTSPQHSSSALRPMARQERSIRLSTNPANLHRLWRSSAIASTSYSSPTTAGDAGPPCPTADEVNWTNYTDLNQSSQFAPAVAVELLDLSEFPTRLALSMAFEDRAHRFVLSRTGGGRLGLSTIGAVWWRRPQPFGLPTSLTDPAHRRFAMSEAATAFEGLYQALDAFWVNDPGRDAAAHHKPWQLVLAQQIGLAIPTTDDQEIRLRWVAVLSLHDSLRRLRPWGEAIKLAHNSEHHTGSRVDANIAPLKCHGVHAEESCGRFDVRRV